MKCEETAIQILLQTPFFREFSVSELSDILAQLTPERKQFAQGEVLVRAGDPAGCVGVVISGSLVMYRSGAGGRGHELSRRLPRDVFGLTALFCSSGQSPVTIAAAAPAEVLFFEIRCLLEDAHYAQRMKDAALRTISQLSVRDIIKMDMLLSPSMRERIMIYFTALREKSGDDTLQLHMSQTELAGYLGVNRSALSRELNRMEREGILEILPNRRYHIMKWRMEIPDACQQKTAAAETYRIQTETLR